jgi:rare lipoprotein A
MKLLKNIFSFYTVAAMMVLLSATLSVNAYASKNEKKDAAKEEKGSTIQTGMASWYGKGFHGKMTANGDVFDLNKFTCASNKYALGTWLRVTNFRTGKSVVVMVNDRMHPRMKRIVDLSKGAAREIGMVSNGIIKVQVENLGRSLPEGGVQRD